MNTLRSTLVILCTLLAIPGFSQKKVTKDLKDFDKVSFGTAGVMHLKQGSTFKVELKGSEDALEEVEATVKGGRLVISSKDKGWFNWSSNNDLEVYVTMPSVEDINVSGSGKLLIEDKLNADDLDLSISGSGSIRGELSARNMDMSISGSGKIDLTGSANDVEIRISGSGSLKAEEFVVKDYRVRVSGSGNCRINADNSINASISGSGSVYYTGKADNVDTSVSGSGRVRKM